MDISLVLTSTSLGLMILSRSISSQTCEGASDGAYVLFDQYCQSVTWELRAYIYSTNGTTLESAGTATGNTVCIPGHKDCYGEDQSSKEYKPSKQFTAYPDGSNTHMIFYWTITNHTYSHASCELPGGGTGTDYQVYDINQQTGYSESSLCN